MRELSLEKSTSIIVPVPCLYKPVGGFLVSHYLSFLLNTSLVIYWCCIIYRPRQSVLFGTCINQVKICSATKKRKIGKNRMQSDMEGKIFIYMTMRNIIFRALLLYAEATSMQTTFSTFTCFLIFKKDFLLYDFSPDAS